MGPLDLVFWILFGVVGYVFIGYPIIIAVLAKLRPRPAHKADILPKISLVIVAYNEERSIATKLKNCLSQDYPSDRLEIIVGSDGSTDRTDAIVSECFHHRVRLIRFDRRRGKASVLNELVPSLSGEIVILSDARQLYAPDVVRQLVMNFADPLVGAASGDLCLVGEEGSPIGPGIGVYWRYEKWIRRNEGLVHSTLGATGAIYAIRKSLFYPMLPDTLLDDVLIPLNIVRQGHRVVFDSSAVAYDQVAQSRHQEFTRKVRTITGNFQVFARERWLLNPFRNPIWFQTVSHKGLRLVAPVFLIALLLLNAALVPVSRLYAATLAGQVGFYLLALAGSLLEKIGRTNRFATACYVFCVLNVTTVISFYRFVTRNHGAMWERVI